MAPSSDRSGTHAQIMSHHSLPPNPMKASPSAREALLPAQDAPSGFSRSGFAPLPHRHSEYQPPAHSSAPEERDWDRGRGQPGGWGHEQDERERLSGREDWDRRPPPPRWEDEYGEHRRQAIYSSQNVQSEEDHLHLSDRPIDLVVIPLLLHQEDILLPSSSIRPSCHTL